MTSVLWTKGIWSIVSKGGSYFITNGKVEAMIQWSKVVKSWAITSGSWDMATVIPHGVVDAVEMLIKKGFIVF